jgi:hypothetical protein
MKYKVSERLTTVQLLLQQGALWRPDDKHQLTEVRRGVFECEPDVTLESVDEMIKHEASYSRQVERPHRNTGDEETPHARDWQVRSFRF